MASLLQILAEPLYFYVLMTLWVIVSVVFVNVVAHAFLRHIFTKTESKLDDIALMTTRNALIVALLACAAYFIALYADLTPILELQVRRISHSILVIALAVCFFELLSIFIFKLQHKAHVRHNSHLISAFPFFRNILRIIIGVIAFIMILDIYSVNITPFVASAGVLGVAVALASKDFIANLFGGISVFFDRPYLVGDYVIIQEKYRGEVMEIGMRSTKIKTRDNVLLSVPNSVMVTNAIINETGYDPELRIRIPLLVRYDSDLEYVEHTLLDIASGHSEIITNPPPLVRYREFGDSGMSLELLIVISDPRDKGRIIHEVVKKIYARFRKDGIHIPYQTQEIYFHKPA